MSGWNAYVDNLMANTECIEEAAICGCTPGQEGLWASSTGGEMCRITKEEIQRLVTTDRSQLFCSGVVVGGEKCAVVRDTLFDPKDGYLALKKKGGDQSFISVAKSNQALIITKGKGNKPGGDQNVKTTGLAEYLKSLNY